MAQTFLEWADACFWLNFFFEITQTSHLSLSVFKSVVCSFVVLVIFDVGENIFDSLVIVLVPEFPREMETVMSKEGFQNWEVEIQSVAPNLEAAVFSHVKVLEAEVLEFRNSACRIVRSAERFGESLFVTFRPPVHCGDGILEAFGMELNRVKTLVKFALYSVFGEAKSSDSEDAATRIRAGRFDVNHENIFHFCYLICF